MIRMRLWRNALSVDLLARMAESPHQLFQDRSSDGGAKPRSLAAAHASRLDGEEAITLMADLMRRDRV
jgi:hypothetical protein